MTLVIAWPSEAGEPDAIAAIVGPSGLSAYQVAVANGFAGTEAEWLASLAAVSVRSSGLASITATLADANNIIETTSDSAVTVEIPPESSVAWPAGCFVEVHQGGFGVVTIQGGSGVTIQSRGGAVDTAGRYAVAGLRKVAADTWRLTGDLA